MAAEIGTIASVLQLLSTVNDFRKAFQAIKDAPLEISHLAKNLQSIGETLDAVEKAVKQYGSPPTDLQQGLDRTLEELRHELDNAWNKTQWSKVTGLKTVSNG